MNVLLSIKPKHADAIMRGDKLFEFRRVPFAERDVETVYLYSTAPVKKVVGLFRVGKVVEDRPRSLWRKFRHVAGLSESEFFSYFRDSDVGYAIEVKRARRLSCPIDPFNVVPGFVPPQSFRYVARPKAGGRDGSPCAKGHSSHEARTDITWSRHAVSLSSSG